CSSSCREPCQGCPGDYPPNMYPGPMKPQGAPPGPGCDLSLPADTPNAFDPDCRSRPDYCCKGMWLSAEYLAWALRDPHIPPLISTGAIGTAGAGVLLQDDNLEYHYWSGARINAGFWLNSDRTVSIEGSGFVLEKKGTSFSANSNGVPPLGVPFFDVNAG